MIYGGNPIGSHPFRVSPNSVGGRRQRAHLGGNWAFLFVRRDAGNRAHRSRNPGRSERVQFSRLKQSRLMSRRGPFSLPLGEGCEGGARGGTGGGGSSGNNASSGGNQGDPRGNRA